MSDEQRVIDALDTIEPVKSTPGDVGRLSSLVVSIILIAAFAIALIAGCFMYIGILNNSTTGDGVIGLSGGIAGAVKSNDRISSVRIDQDQYGEALILCEHVEGLGDYETRIYKYDDRIVREYAQADAPYAPDRSVTIMKSTTFSCELEDEMLKMECDSGEVLVKLHCKQGGDGR